MRAQGKLALIDAITIHNYPRLLKAVVATNRATLDALYRP